MSSNCKQDRDENFCFKQMILHMTLACNVYQNESKGVD